MNSSLLKVMIFSINLAPSIDLSAPTTNLAAARFSFARVPDAESIAGARSFYLFLISAIDLAYWRRVAVLTPVTVFAEAFDGDLSEALAL